MVPRPRRVEPRLPWRSPLPVLLRVEAGRHLSYSTPSTTSPITWLAILENHQEADGSVGIPEALQPYMGGLDRIT